MTHDSVDLVRLRDGDRAALKEAGDLLLQLAGAQRPEAQAHVGYLAGRLHALAGRVTTAQEEER